MNDLRPFLAMLHVDERLWYSSDSCLFFNTAILTFYLHHQISTGRGGAGNIVRSPSRDIEPESRGHINSANIAAKVCMHVA